MSLLTNAMEDCVFLNKKMVPDGYGGTVVQWDEGAEFKAAIAFNTSIQGRIAQQQGVTNLYTVLTRKEITLDFHDVFRRLSDGKVFRITSDGEDSKTPTGARLNLRQVSAEEWRLGDG